MRTPSPVNLGAGDRDLDTLTIHKPSNRDFYRWQAPADGTAVADLLFAQADGDLDLLLWQGGESVAISNSNTDNEQLTFAVTGGHTYLLEVVGKNGATSPYYGLTDRRTGTGAGRVRTERFPGHRHELGTRRRGVRRRQHPRIVQLGFLSLDPGRQRRRHH